MSIESSIRGCPQHPTAISSCSENLLVAKAQRMSSLPPRCGIGSTHKLDDGGKREEGLKKQYWQVMIHHGAGLDRFLNTSGSAWGIVDNVVKRNGPKGSAIVPGGKGGSGKTCEGYERRGSAGAGCRSIG
jgi:hypothetical protein